MNKTGGKQFLADLVLLVHISAFWKTGTIGEHGQNGTRIHLLWSNNYVNYS